MKKLTIHTLQHVPFEGLGCIEAWIVEHGHTLTNTLFYQNTDLPELDDFDWLVIMGGPMGVYDDAIYPWLPLEKEFIRRAIEHNKTVIGICLGSQLIAEVLGASVYPNKQKEIGWYEITKTKPASELSLLADFEETLSVFHWHGDTFSLPAGSVRLFSSEVCQNQCFLFNEKVLGLQFHLEVSRQSLTEMLENGTHELKESETIQSASQILNQTSLIQPSNQKMVQLLDYFSRL